MFAFSLVGIFMLMCVLIASVGMSNLKKFADGNSVMTKLMKVRIAMVFSTALVQGRDVLQYFCWCNVVIGVRYRAGAWL